MAEEQWVGRFIVKYDEVDVENLKFEAQQKNKPYLSVLRADAEKRAEKAFKGLHLRTINAQGERNARVIFTTREEASDGQAAR